MPHSPTASMPKYFCDYCDVYLTHDSMSVRKAHNSGRNHLRNVIDYYEQIGHEKAQSVIDSITSSYAAEGQANPMLQIPGGPGFPPPMPGFPQGMIICSDSSPSSLTQRLRYASSAFRNAWWSASAWSRHATTASWSRNAFPAVQSQRPSTSPAERHALSATWWIPTKYARSASGPSWRPTSWSISSYEWA